MGEDITTVDAQLEKIVLAMESIVEILEADNNNAKSLSKGLESEKTEDEPSEEKKELIDEPIDEPKEETKLKLDDKLAGDDDAEY